MDYFRFLTLPFQHQYDTFIQTRDLEFFALLWEQGTGKTKLIIDTACYLYETGKIDGLLIVAPNGAQQNWILNEIPTHFPKHIRSLRSHSYSTGSASTFKHKQSCEALIDNDGFSVLAMSYNSFTTDKGAAAAKRFLKKRRVMFVADESHHIKTIGRQCKRTRYMVAAAKLAPYRRIMSGTQADNPFDMYAPFQFLKKDFWVEHGFASYTAFKTHFGIWIQQQFGSSSRPFMKLVRYRNVDQIREIVAPMSSRVLKEDVLDLPPKLYGYHYVEMSKEQKKLYEQLRDEFYMELTDGREIEAPLAVVRLVRLQQVLCGYVPGEEGEPPIHLLDGKNPRLNALVSIVKDIPHDRKAIIWARFQKDIDLIIDALCDEGLLAVRYDGRVKPEQRLKALESFQDTTLGDGGAQFLVGNPEAGGESLTLHAASTVIYYNNSFKLRQRLQSEDRAHRIGQNNAVNYIDLVTQGTIDEHIVKNLRGKFDIAAKINGDKLRDWLQV